MFEQALGDRRWTGLSDDMNMYNTVATRGINFGILIKIPQNVELDLP